MSLAPGRWLAGMVISMVISPAGGAAAGAGPRDCGLTASINYFFTPVRRKLSDLVHFAGDPFYDFLSGDERLAARENRWQPAEDGVEVERDEL